MFLLRYIINICIFLPAILGLFVIATKLSANQYSKMQGKKYTKVLEKTMIAKDTYSLVIQMGDNIYSGILSPTGFNVVKELDKKEIEYFNYNLNRDIVNSNAMNINDYSFDKIKPYAQSFVLKLKGLLNRISKERL